MALSPDQYQFFMSQALELAKVAEFQTQPNPMVGAVLVSEDGQILSTGYHRQAGGPHAEVYALQDLQEAPEDSILFVTLEPCSHHGKTPPCADLIVEKKVPHVVIGQTDPNPLVAGRGIARLEEAGIKVTSGVLEEECKALNYIFNRHIQKQRPYITLKAGITLDGKIAMASGESQWITSEESRQYVHQLRSERQAILVGKNTFLQDNPRLDDRASQNPRQPIPIIVSSQAEVREDSHLFHRKGVKYYLACEGCPQENQQKIRAAGFTLILIPVQGSSRKGVQLSEAFARLYKEGIASILVEGGSEIFSSIIQEGLADELLLFMAPRIIGQGAAPSWCGELNLEKLQDTPVLKFESYRPIGPDLLLRAEFK